MCLPALLPAAASAAGAAGAATTGLSALQMLSIAASAVGGLMQARGYQQAAKERSAILEQQAEQEDIRAQDAVKRGQEKVRRHLLEAGQLRGKQKAMMSAAGVDISSGSPLAVILDSETIADLDAQTIARNADREAAGISANAADTRAQAQYEKRKGARNATTSLLTTGMSVADKWYKYT